MEDIKLTIDQNKTISYTKINTEDDTEIYDFNYEKELPVTSANNSTKNKIRSINQQHSFIYKRIGNTFCFLGDKRGNPKILIGPHWPMYICFCSFMSFFYFLLFYSSWNLLNIILKIGGIINFSMFFLSYTFIFLANPGMPTINENSFIGKPREKYKYCNECKIWVSNEKSVEHCFECDICVEGYDHHCPWTGKCIGKNNIYCFYIFITSIIISFVYFIFSLTYAVSKYEAPKKSMHLKIKKQF